MLFGFGLKSSILLIFFSQGIVFSFLLLRKGIQDQNVSCKWLSLLLFLGAMYIVPFMCGYAGWYSVKIYREILFFVPFQQLLLIGPVLFFYTQSLLDTSFKFTKRDLWHLAPAFLYLIYSLIVFVTDKLLLDEYYFYADGRDKDLSPWYQVAGLVSMMGYLFASLRYYGIYRRIAFDVISFAETVLFKWTRNFLIAFLLLCLLRILFFILNPEWGEFGSKFWYYLCFSGIFYYIALSGYANTVKAAIPFRAALLDRSSEIALDTSNSEAEKKTSSVTGEIPELETWKSKLLTLMEAERVYENPKLSLTDIAQQLGANPKLVSQIINQGFEMNFNDFVNSHRVEAVKERMKKGDYRSITLLGIALESGFNSKATFNRAFKKNTSQTPQKFLESLT